LNAGQRVLSRADEVISLPPKAMDILLVLVRRAGQLVEKDELMREVWPDSFVEEGNLATNIFTLRRALGDQRSEAQFIETIARHGYRFVAHVKQVTNGTGSDAAPTTLAVLPFENDTGDAQLEYLADGVGENIIRSLSQISKLRVMSRSSTGRFKGKEVDLKNLASELRVDSILVGRLMSRNAGLVISVELVDAANGWLLWGQGFD
jgi:DNA-binding winged helix-turn-helix (wHTH) protein